MAEAAVAALLLECQRKLTADELNVVQSYQHLLVKKDLVSSDIISQLSFEQLVSAVGLTPGAAAALKKAFPSAAGVSKTGTVSQGVVYVDVVLELGNTQLAAFLLVDPGCDVEFILSEYKAAQLGIEPVGYPAAMQMSRCHVGRQIMRRGVVLTALQLEGEGDEVMQDPRRSKYLEVWADEGTGSKSSSSSSSSATSSAGSSRLPSLVSDTTSSMLRIRVLSPTKEGKDSKGYVTNHSVGYDAILGAPGMAGLSLGIDEETMRLYRRQTPKHYRKPLRRQQQQQQQQQH